MGYRPSLSGQDIGQALSLCVHCTLRIEVHKHVTKNEANIRPSWSIKDLSSVEKKRVYLGVKTCEVFLCFVAVVRVRVYYVDFVFFVLHHW